MPDDNNRARVATGVPEPEEITLELLMRKGMTFARIAELRKDISGGVRAIELVAKLAGFLGDQMSPEQYKAALKRAGWELTRKDGLKAVGGGK